MVHITKDGGNESKITNKLTAAVKTKSSGGGLTEHKLALASHTHCFMDFETDMGIARHIFSVFKTSQTPGGYMTMKNKVSNSKVNIISLNNPTQRRYRVNCIDG
jgi:hypothetical protein